MANATRVFFGTCTLAALTIAAGLIFHGPNQARVQCIDTTCTVSLERS